MSEGLQNQHKETSRLNSSDELNQSQETNLELNDKVGSTSTPRIVQRLVNAPRGRVKANDVIALQRSIGNQAVQRLIKERNQKNAAPIPAPVQTYLHAEVGLITTAVQRRVPKLNAAVNASLQNNLGAPLPKVRKKLVRTLNRAYDKLDNAQKADVQVILTPLGIHNVVNFFNNPTAATDPQIQSVRKAIRQAYMNNGGANKLGVYYPARNIQNGKPALASPEIITLNAEIPNALVILNTLASAANPSNEWTVIQNIFGDNGGVPNAAQVQMAKTAFATAHATLTTLQNDLAGINPDRLGFKVDNRMEGKPQHVGGSSPQGGPIFLTPASFAPAHIVYTLVHESMHASDGGIIDHFYLNTGGYTNATFAKKITNASHFEEAARQLQANMPHRVLLTGPAPIVANIPPITLEAKDLANQYITRAWVKAYNAHLTLQRMVTAQNNPIYVPGNRTLLDRYSRILGLTIHNRPSINEPKITDLDLAIAEDRVGKLGDVITAVKQVNLTTIQDNRSNPWGDLLGVYNSLTRKDHLREEILRAALTASGRIRKDITKDLLMITVLYNWDQSGNSAPPNPPVGL